MTDVSACEQLADVLEGLEFQGVAAGIEEEQRRLLAHLPLEAHVRFDDERRAALAQPLRQAFPVLPRQHHAKVRHRYVVAVHGVLSFFFNLTVLALTVNLVSNLIQ